MRARLRTAETWVALALSRALVFILPFRLLSALLGTSRPDGASGMGPPDPAHLAAAHGIGRRIERLAPAFGSRDTCLMRAVAGWLLLTRRGIPSVLRFGVRRTEGRLEAHAWLRVSGETALGGAGAESFVPIADFGQRRAGDARTGR